MPIDKSAIELYKLLASQRPDEIEYDVLQRAVTDLAQNIQNSKTRLSVDKSLGTAREAIKTELTLLTKLHTNLSGKLELLSNKKRAPKTGVASLPVGKVRDDAYAVAVRNVLNNPNADINAQLTPEQQAAAEHQAANFRKLYAGVAHSAAAKAKPSTGAAEDTTTDVPSEEWMDHIESAIDITYELDISGKDANNASIATANIHKIQEVVHKVEQKIGLLEKGLAKVQSTDDKEAVADYEDAIVALKDIINRATSNIGTIKNLVNLQLSIDKGVIEPNDIDSLIHRMLRNGVNELVARNALEKQKDADVQNLPPLVMRYLLRKLYDYFVGDEKLAAVADRIVELLKLIPDSNVGSGGGFSVPGTLRSTTIQDPELREKPIWTGAVEVGSPHEKGYSRKDQFETSKSPLDPSVVTGGHATPATLYGENPEEYNDISKLPEWMKHLYDARQGIITTDEEPDVESHIDAIGKRNKTIMPSVADIAKYTKEDLAQYKEYLESVDGESYDDGGVPSNEQIDFSEDGRPSGYLLDMIQDIRSFRDYDEFVYQFNKLKLMIYNRVALDKLMPYIENTLNGTYPLNNKSVFRTIAYQVDVISKERAKAAEAYLLDALSDVIKERAKKIVPAGYSTGGKTKEKIEKEQDAVAAQFATWVRGLKLTGKDGQVIGSTKTREDIEELADALSAKAYNMLTDGNDVVASFGPPDDRKELTLADVEAMDPLESAKDESEDLKFKPGETTYDVLNKDRSILPVSKIWARLADEPRLQKRISLLSDYKANYQQALEAGLNNYCKCGHHQSHHSGGACSYNLNKVVGETIPNTRDDETGVFSRQPRLPKQAAATSVRKVCNCANFEQIDENIINANIASIDNNIQLLQARLNGDIPPLRWYQNTGNNPYSIQHGSSVLDTGEVSKNHTNMIRGADARYIDRDLTEISHEWNAANLKLMKLASALKHKKGTTPADHAKLTREFHDVKEQINKLRPLMMQTRRAASDADAWTAKYNVVLDSKNLPVGVCTCGHGEDEHNNGNECNNLDCECTAFSIRPDSEKQLNLYSALLNIGRKQTTDAVRKKYNLDDGEYFVSISAKDALNALNKLPSMLSASARGATVKELINTASTIKDENRRNTATKLSFRLQQSLEKGNLDDAENTLNKLYAYDELKDYTYKLRASSGTHMGPDEFDGTLSALEDFGLKQLEKTEALTDHKWFETRITSARDINNALAELCKATGDETGSLLDNEDFGRYLPLQIVIGPRVDANKVDIDKWKTGKPDAKWSIEPDGTKVGFDDIEASTATPPPASGSDDIKRIADDLV